MSSINISANDTIDYNGTNFVINSQIYACPITINNTSGGNVTVTLDFSSPLNNPNCYITIGTNNITFDGININKMILMWCLLIFMDIH